jgi:hypothetical protein
LLLAELLIPPAIDRLQHLIGCLELPPHGLTTQIDCIDLFLLRADDGLVLLDVHLKA